WPAVYLVAPRTLFSSSCESHPASAPFGSAKVRTFFIPCKFFLKFFQARPDPCQSISITASGTFQTLPLPQFLIPTSSRLGVQMYDLLPSPQIFLTIFF